MSLCFSHSQYPSNSSLMHSRQNLKEIKSICEVNHLNDGNLPIAHCMYICVRVYVCMRVRQRQRETQTQREKVRFKMYLYSHSKQVNISSSFVRSLFQTGHQVVSIHATFW